MLHKITAGARVFREKGVKGLVETAGQRLRELRRKRPGGLVQIDGCRFDLKPLAVDVQYLLLAGDYECFERAALSRYLHPGLPLIELGGSIGVVSCIANKLLRDPTRHVVLEANPGLLPVIEANRARNGSGFRVIAAALAYGRDTLEFPVSENSLMSGLYNSSSKTVRVKATSLRDVHGSAGFGRFTLICDIEGGEADLIEQDSDLIRDSVQTMMVELHPGILGHQKTNELVIRMLQIGFRIALAERDTFVFENGSGAEPAR